MRRDNVNLGGLREFVVMRRQRRGAVRSDLAEQASTMIATSRQLPITRLRHIHGQLLCRGLRCKVCVQVRACHEGLSRGGQQQQQYRQALHSMALVISSTIFLASPNTIIVLSM